MKSLRCLSLRSLLFGFSILMPASLSLADPEPTAVNKTPVAGQTETPASPVSEPQKSAVENSVVKIFAQVRRPELLKPWSKQSPQEISGSGIVIEGKRILTNAHVVMYASELQVQANQAGDKISATVEAVAPGIDLAVLKLEDESFFDSHPALARISKLPQIKDPVLVYGFPTGGTSLSITKGIVSRIEFTAYNYATSGLRVQIDAAINPGNSGGPAIVGDKVIGLAFSHLVNAENIGYIIPSEEIDEFLNAVASGHYAGKPALYDEFQNLENGALRNFLKIDKAVEGLVVNQPFSDDPSYPLKKWDVVTKIGGNKIDDQGMVKIGEGLRVRFTYFVQKLAKNGTVPLSVVRQNKELALELPVMTEPPRVIKPLQGEYPPYFICGPVPFTVATDDLVSGFSASAHGGGVMAALSFLGSPLISRHGDKPAFDGEQLVVIAGPFFPHKLAKGYSNQTLRVVEAVNEVKIKNLLHLVSVLRDAKDEFIIIRFAGRAGETLVFPREALMQSTEGILTDNGVRSLGSPDVMAVWNAVQPTQAASPTTEAKARKQ